MIRIAKGPTPPHLSGLLQQWTDELLDAIARNDTERKKTLGNRYSDQRIKRALLDESREKCAYCESRLSATSYPRVDHIQPRAIAPHLTFDWPNLVIACEVCNSAKRDYWNPDLALLNPTVDEPRHHLWAPDWFVRAWLDSPRGAFTIDRLDLNRAGLVERRKERLERVQLLIDRWRNATSDAEQAAYRFALDLETADDKEFLLMVRVLVHGVLNESS